MKTQQQGRLCSTTTCKYGEVWTGELSTWVHLFSIFQNQAKQQQQEPHCSESCQPNKPTIPTPDSSAPNPNPRYSLCLLRVILYPIAWLSGTTVLEMLAWSQSPSHCRQLQYNIKPVGAGPGGRPKNLAVKFLSVLRKQDRERLCVAW